MAHLLVRGDRLIVKLNPLNPLERLAAFRRRPIDVPLAAVERVERVRRPIREVVVPEVRFSGWELPATPLAVFISRPLADGSGDAFIAAYAFRPATVVRLGPAAGRWRLFVVSGPAPAGLEA